MEIVLSSGFLDSHGVNLSALYCDKIVLPSDLVGFITLDETSIARNEDGTYVKSDEGTFEASGVVSSIYKTISPEIEGAMESYLKEGVIRKAEDCYVDDTRVLDELVIKILEDADKDGRYEDFFCYNSTLVSAEAPSMVTHIALIISSAYRTSIGYNLPILTDNRLIDFALRRYSDILPGLREDNIVKMRSSLLASRALSEFLPDISDVHPDKIMEVRGKFTDELGAFRQKMRTLSKNVKENPWNEESRREIDFLVETDIRPEVENLRNALRKSNYKLVGDVFLNIKDSKTYIPFIGSVLGQIDVIVAASLSAGVAGFQALYNFRADRKKVQDESGLSFLINAPSRLKR